MSEMEPKNSTEKGPENVTARTGENLNVLAESGAEERAEFSPGDIEALKERARVEALGSAISVEAGGAEKAKQRDSYAPKKKQAASKRQKNESLKRQIKEVQGNLNVTSRLFSKVVHNKVVEKTSDIVGSTLARPNAMLAGAFCAFILTLAVYIIAKNIGYRLSGFETIAAFVVGWLLGIIYDYLRLIITGKK